MIFCFPNLVFKKWFGKTLFLLTPPQLWNPILKIWNPTSMVFSDQAHPGPEPMWAFPFAFLPLLLIFFFILLLDSKRKRVAESETQRREDWQARLPLSPHHPLLICGPFPLLNPGWEVGDGGSWNNSSEVWHLVSCPWCQVSWTVPVLDYLGLSPSLSESKS